MRLWGFQPLPARLGFVELFPEFVGFMGRFVEFVLGFVGLLGSSLIFREVRWICPGFVDFMGCSLDYRLFVHAKERNPRKHWNPDPWTDRIVGIQ